jgi:hypothetical protein
MADTTKKVHVIKARTVKKNGKVCCYRVRDFTGGTSADESTSAGAHRLVQAVIAALLKAGHPVKYYSVRADGKTSSASLYTITDGRVCVSAIAKGTPAKKKPAKKVKPSKKTGAKKPAKRTSKKTVAAKSKGVIKSYKKFCAVHKLFGKKAGAAWKKYKAAHPKDFPETKASKKKVKPSGKKPSKKTGAKKPAKRTSKKTVAAKSKGVIKSYKKFCAVHKLFGKKAGAAWKKYKAAHPKDFPETKATKKKVKPSKRVGGKKGKPSKKTGAKTGAKKPTKKPRRGPKKGSKQKKVGGYTYQSFRAMHIKKGTRKNSISKLWKEWKAKHSAKKKAPAKKPTKATKKASAKKAQAKRVKAAKKPAKKKAAKKPAKKKAAKKPAKKKAAKKPAKKKAAKKPAKKKAAKKPGKKKPTAATKKAAAKKSQAKRAAKTPKEPSKGSVLPSAAEVTGARKS